VKKIALIAVATLGLAACGGNEAETNTVNTTEDYNVTADNMMTDVNAAATDAQNAADAALDNAGAAIDNAGEAVENAAEAVETNGM
jgi:ABC-type uncharacterized transport system auxiliary subunit